MPVPIIIVGLLILVSAFSYSMVATFNRESEIIATDTNATTTKELMPMGDGQMMNMPGMDMGMMMFRDGTYTNAVRYEIPYGYIEPMEVLLTFKDGIITDSDVTFNLVNPVSADYQRSFKSYYKDEVVGQLVEAVSLARMGGASLTNKAFDMALDRIKQESVGEKTIDNSIVSMNYSGGPQGRAIIDTDNLSDGGMTGVYKVSDSYQVMPGLIEPMESSITLEGGVIVKAAVSFNSPEQMSRMHQELFERVYQKQIIGQPINTAEISRIGSASLTTEAFNKALQLVRGEIDNS